MMKILVLFVEPMLYIMDLIKEVYEKTEYQFRYFFITQGLTGKDNIKLPHNSYVLDGNFKRRKMTFNNEIKNYRPNFVIINGYSGFEQRTLINICLKNKIPYAIESDTPLHIPNNLIKALFKKLYLRKIFKNKYAFGFPGGTLQKENFLYYGIPENRNFIMPMSIDHKRLKEVFYELPSKQELKFKKGILNSKTYLFVGRLVPVKNLQTLIKAFRVVHEYDSDTSLIIVGSGSEEKKLKDLTRSFKLDSVYFEGYVVFPKLVEYYKMADLFILPSSYEPWGLVVNEALSLNLPVIVSNKVGCRVDLVRDDNRIFEVDDYLDLAKKMGDSINFNQEINPIDNWNYQIYHKKFEFAVKNICKD